VVKIRDDEVTLSAVLRPGKPGITHSDVADNLMSFWHGCDRLQKETRVAKDSLILPKTTKMRLCKKSPRHANPTYILNMPVACVWTRIIGDLF
jgi:hypothetical protein